MEVFMLFSHQHQHNNLRYLESIILSQVIPIVQLTSQYLDQTQSKLF